MSNPFAFVPRKVAAKSATAGSSSAAPVASVSGPFKVKPKDSERKGSLPYSDDECAILVCLALSDHALWSDPDLRRTIEWNAEGFIPLSYVFLHAPMLLQSGLTFDTATEGVVARAVRTHAAAVLEVRMLTEAPSKSAWGGKDKVGGYEVRRRDSTAPQRDCTRNDWEARTIYLENIPPQYRTIPGIARFLRGLLPSSATADSLSQRVQSIFLPPHYQDQPSDLPKCKGFALVTLAEISDVDAFLHAWPWGSPPEKTVAGSTPADDAVKYGLRALPKHTWDELNDTYRACRQQLLDEVYLETPDDIQPEDFEPESIQVHANRPSKAEAPAPQRRAETTEVLPDAPYPPGCLVFVRHVHPETNKTALRTLLSAAFPASEAHALDYIDFNKGMDTCHVRLATPSYTQALVAHFSAHGTAQLHGLDDAGSADGVHLVVEVVHGTKEALYWEKVPEKVRRAAVSKASGGAAEDARGTEDPPKRKRRKREK
ncbi:hypothetical protein PLICRDRAFT_148867 [Plicaturopsis crispa FD-325 SS-3]|nr:hypothetical protein PLICRDRAFT_148867 [Plicaturopsis crispa FD-325 SS-3]